jgi:PAS domain S-box-containing protein/diguanylate cyclase (GGDEF)-like protein
MTICGLQGPSAPDMDSLPTLHPLLAAASNQAPGSLQLADHVQIGIFVVADERIVYANPGLAALFGWPDAAHLVGQSHLVLIPQESHGRATAVLARRLAGKAGRPGQMLCQRRDGSQFAARISARPIEHQGRAAVLMTAIDVSEVAAALQRAEWSASLLARTEALCRSGSFEYDAASGAVTPSAGLVALLGLPPEAAGQPQGIDDLAWVPAEERAFVAGIWRSASAGEAFDFQHRVLAADGRRLVVLHRGVLGGPGAAPTRGVALLQDITAQREAEQRIQELAHHDDVTGLPNRPWMLDQIDAAMHAARWDGSGFALLAIDVPRIADVKAKMGFGAGDTLAMAFAARLREHAGAGIVAHLADTEFAVLLPGAAGAEAAFEKARELQLALQAPVRLSATDAFPLCVIGVALFPASGESPDTLLQAAQTARLDVAGASGIALFRPETTTRALREMHLEGALRHAIASDSGFELHYQPQVDLSSGAICGAEALLRWNVDGIGPVSPDEFIPIAERCGLIGAIGEWVARHACRQAAAWRRAGVPSGRIGINLSPAQLQRPDLAEHLAAIIAEAGLEPSALGVEITEGMLIGDIEHAAAVLRSVKALGVEIALDDFGTGYSSLSSLARLPIDVLKIDRSFVEDVTAATQQVSVTRAIINLAHGLQMKVLAEGVETEGQLGLLAANGCDRVQGYWFSRPVAADAFAAMVRENKRLPEHFVLSTRRERTLLLVDDEENIVAALKRLLRRDGYKIVTAASAAEGLQRLAEHNVDVIVSDQRMPGMTGVEFLHRAKALYPDTVRMVLSGYTELQSIIDAVNEGAIYKFLTKPWDDERLRGHVAEAFRQKELTDENRRLAQQVEAANSDLAVLNQRLGGLLEQQRRQASVLAASVAGSRALLDDLPAPVLGVDPDGVVAYANGAAFATLGGTLLGCELADVVEAPPGADSVCVGGRRHRVLERPLADAATRGRLLVFVPLEEAA